MSAGYTGAGRVRMELYRNRAWLEAVALEENDDALARVAKRSPEFVA